MPLVSRILITFATLLAVVALVGSWLDRQLLNTDDLTATSAALIADPAIRTPIADELAATIADGSRAEAALASVLPPQLQPLAPQAGALTRELTQRATERLLAAPRVQRAWVAATRITQQQLIDLIEGRGVTVDGRGVVLDLRPLAGRIATEIGLDGSRIERLPGERGRVVIMQANDLRALQRAGDLLGLLAWFPAVLAILLAGLAIRVAARGEPRRRAVLATGGSLVGATLLVLAGRSIGGDALASSLGGDDPRIVAAASAAWSITSSLLADLTVVVLLAGVVTAGGAWFVGPGPRARAVRARVAPFALDRPALAYGATSIVFLALLVWGPLTVLRRPLAILVLGVLLLLGVWALRRVIREERAAEQV